MRLIKISLQVLYERIIEKFTKKYLFNKRLKEFHKLSISSKKRFEVIEKRMILDDDTVNTTFDRHYIYHPAWATRILKELNPSKHIDISSTLHFCTILSAFIPVDFYDYRPANIFLTNLSSLPANLTNLPFEGNSINSLSCMHTIEHIGLGRYGDDIDYNGDLKAIKELIRVLKTGGTLLVVVPIGKPKIIFNAHRIYGAEQFINYFSELNLIEFSLIPDDALKSGLIKNPTLEFCNAQQYACGCFWFRKK